MDRSPDELGSQDNDLDDELDTDDDDDDDLEGTITSEGERIIYPWMKKIHVAGVGKHSEFLQTPFCEQEISSLKRCCCCFIIVILLSALLL
jgi:hypothetical protein